MSAHATIDLAAPGAGLEAMKGIQKAVIAKMRVMRQSGKDALISVAITAMKSLRAASRVAVADGDGVSVLDVSGVYTPGWRYVGGHRRRVVRVGGAKHGPGVNFVNKGGGFMKGEVPHVYLVTDRKYPSEVIATNPAQNQYSPRRYIILAHGPQVAKDYAVARRIRRIKKYQGLAKWVMGLAAAKTSDRPMTELAPNAGQLAHGGNLATVRKQLEGDHCSIDVTDALLYAELALKPGESVDLCMRRAANSTIGQVNAYLQKNLASLLTSTPLEIPFPEIARK